MMKRASLSLAVFAALTGCASDPTAPDPGGGTGSGSGEPQPEPQMDIIGTYRINSTFDIATNMPGNAGDFVNGLIEATDDPDDPASWIVDQVLAGMEDGTFKTILVNAKPFVIGDLNQRITNLAPDLVGTITELGQRMADLTKNLGVDERLAINVVDQTHLGRMTADGVKFLVDGNTVDVLFADHDIDDVHVDAVLVQYSKNDARITIGQHTMPLPYGKIVRLGLDIAIIPAIDPSANSITDLLDNVVDCQGVGQAIANEIGFSGTASLFAGACLTGLDKIADEVYDQIVASDAKLDLNVTGDARAVDGNNDYKLDKLTFGKWAGTMSYSGESAPLADPATFVGARMNPGQF